MVQSRHFKTLISNGYCIYCSFLALFTTFEPRSFMSASKFPKWVATMSRRNWCDSSNQTWELVPRPLITNVIGSKWVIRIKYRSDGTIEHHKARLVAQGFFQILGTNLSHTFSPVFKVSTVRVILALSVYHKWPLHQLDVKNAFFKWCSLETSICLNLLGF